MTVDYKKLCIELFGTDDVEELRKIADTINMKNNRNAGRKKEFSSSQIKEMLKMQEQNIPQRIIAEHFKTTRQTVARYLNSEDFDYSMKIDYMFKTSVCTTIYVDFKNEKINIVNKTGDILHRAFGMNESPSWQDFLDFVSDRCFSKSRGDRKDMLKALDIDSYDPIQIIEKTKGKTYEDRQWMKFKYRSSYETN